MNSTNQPRAVPLNPFKWRVLTWLLFLSWLAIGVGGNTPFTPTSQNGVVVHTTVGFGWPFCHSESHYSGGVSSTTRHETSFVLAIVDLFLIALVQFSIVVVVERWLRGFSLRALFLLTTLSAILVLVGKEAVVNDRFLVMEGLVYLIYFSPAAVWIVATVLSRFGFTHFTDKHFLIAVAMAFFGMGIWGIWDFIPGTLRHDQNGILHGTGKETFYYDSEAVKLEQWYRAGVMTESTWYRPDGTQVATSVFDKERGGVGYYLYEDGRIKGKIPYRYSPAHREYFAHGTGTYYAPDGTVEKTVEFSDGQRIEERNPPSPSSESPSADMPSGPVTDATRRMVGRWGMDGEELLIISLEGERVLVSTPATDTWRMEISDAKIVDDSIHFVQRNYLRSGDFHYINGVPCNWTITMVEEDTLNFEITTAHSQEAESGLLTRMQ